MLLRYRIGTTATYRGIAACYTPVIMPSGRTEGTNVAEQRQVDEGEHVQGSIGKGMKRRGILAAAGAAVVVIAAKQTAQPVLAAGLTLETTNTVTGGTTTHQRRRLASRTRSSRSMPPRPTANVLYIDAIRGHGQFTAANPRLRGRREAEHGRRSGPARDGRQRRRPIGRRG